MDLKTDLYTYQKEDVKRMIYGTSWLCFSEMGTGKTPTALGVAELGNFKFPLIVCPNTLRLEWKRQIEDWIGLNQVSIAGYGKNSWDKMYALVDGLTKGHKYRVVNYEMFRSKQHLEVLKEFPFDLIIMDEVHRIKNVDSKSVTGIWEFLKTKPGIKIIAMSGSPIMNYPDDLYVPLSLVRPEKYPRNKTDKRRFIYKYMYYAPSRTGGYTYGVRNMSSLRAETQEFIVRRTKAEVLPFLPEKYKRRVILEMQEDQRKIYDKMERDLKAVLDTGESIQANSSLALITRLRQLNLDPNILEITSSSAKTDFIKELIEDTDEKIVIFSCFERYIQILKKLLPKALVITGKVPVEERADIVKKFQTTNSKILLGTIQSMGEGLTLTAASNVVLVDRWWNEPTNSQAVDRLHRIGQKNAVQVIIPVVEDSIDSALDEILERKVKASNDYLPETQVREFVIRERLGL